MRYNRQWVMPLEPRLMFDGAALVSATESHTDPTATDSATDAASASHATDDKASNTTAATTDSAATTAERKEVAFIDATLADAQTLAASLRAGIEIVYIQAGQNALDVMADWAATHTGYDAIHILTHGSDGSVALGTQSLTAASLNDSTVRDKLATLGTALTADGDLMLYGCDIASTQNGQDFIAALAAITGADVAASDDSTGAARLDADWNLEKSTGSIETATAMTSGSENAWDHELATADFTGSTLSGSGAASTVTTTSGGITITGSTTSSGGVSNVDQGYGNGEMLFKANGVAGGSPDSDAMVLTFSSAVNLDTLVLYAVRVDGTYDANGKSVVKILLTPTGGSNSAVTFTFNDSVDDGIQTVTLNWTGVTSVSITRVAFANADTTFSVGVDDIAFTTAPAGPSVSSINRASAQTVPTASTSVNYTVTFSEAVSGVDASDFALTPSGNATGTIGTPTTSDGGITWTVPVTGISGDGTLRLDLNSSGTGIKNGSNTDIAAGFTSGQTYTLDHTAPSAPSVAISADTGSSGSDGVTKTATQTVTVTADGGTTLDIDYGDGGAHGSASGSHTYASDGKYTLSVTATDAAGNVSSAGTKVIVIDRSAPTNITPSVTQLAVTDATNGATFATLTATDATNISGYTDAWTYTLGGTDAGKFSITGGTLVINNVGGLTAGSYSVDVTATDTAGNTYTKTLSLSVVSGPSTTVSAASLSADTGSGATDWITKTASQTISGTLSAALIAGERVEVSFDNGTTWQTVTTSVGDTSFSLTTTLAGANTFKARVTDSIGSSTAFSKAFTLDTTIATPSAPDLIAGSDSGSSSTDNITSTTTPTFSGTADIGATVTLYDTNGTTVLGTATADGTGAWSITSSALSEGSHTLTVKAEDVAGNISTASSGLAVTIDTTAPSAPSTPDLIAASDSGTSNTDNITTNTTPTFSGTAEAGATVKLYDTDGTTLLGTGTADGTGAWSITTSTLGVGTHSITAKATDAAGNTSVASSGLSVEIVTGPAAPTGLTISSDTGSSNSDGITNDTTLSISGSGPANATILVYKDGVQLGTATADGTGAWTYDYTGTTLAAGAHAFTAVARVSDQDSTASTALNVTIDTTAPTVTSIVRQTPSSATTNADSLVYRVTFGEAVTNVDAADFTVTGTTGTVTNVTSAGGNAYDVTISGGDLANLNGTVTLGFAGGQNIADSAGNALAATTPTGTNNATYTLDNTAPTVTSIVRQTPSSSPTNATSVVYRVTFGEGVSNVDAADFSVSGTTGTVTSVVSAGGNAYDITVSGGNLATLDGTVTLSFAGGQNITDSAGNALAATTPTGTNDAGFVMDHTAPGAPTLTATGGGDSTSATVTGTAEANATVKIYDGDTLLGTVTADGTGAYTYTGTLSVGAHTLKAKAQDVAGNESGYSATASVTVNAPVTTVSAPAPTPTPLPTPTPTPAPPTVDTGTGSNAVLVTTVRDTAVSDKPADIQTVVRTVTLTGTSVVSAVTSGSSSSLGGGFTASLGDTRTQGGGNTFQVALAGRSPGGGDALVINTRVPDAAFDVGSRISVTIPGDAFAHTRADASVTLTAKTANGAALPSWMAFNPRTGTFEGTPPPNFRGEVQVQVTARDNDGREVVQTFKIQVGVGQGNAAPGGRTGALDGGPDKVADKPVGRPSLTQQLRDFSKDGQQAKQAALFGLKPTKVA